MTISEVDKKYLGRFAGKFQNEYPLLAQSLLQILGIFTMLSGYVTKARKLRRLDISRNSKSSDLYLRIVWLAREGLKILEEYVLPMVANYGELKTLSYKLRASFYYLFVLFHNQPPISLKQTHENVTLTLGEVFDHETMEKSDEYISTIYESVRSNSTPSTHSFEAGYEPVVTTANLNSSFTEFSPDDEANFLIPAIDYRPTARHCFQEATALANQYLYGSHPIRLSLMVEYSTYIFECLHNCGESRQLAKNTV
ncbi:putative 14-3-3 protein, partial [Erysiphe neolycopersici]